MNILCPSCNGGRTRERSFHLWTNRAGAPMGTCYRASCGYVGPADRFAPAPVDPEPAPREPLGSTHRDWLLRRVLPPVVRRLGAFSDGPRLGLPVYSPSGEDVGHVSRAVDGSRPKALDHTPVGYALGSWYTGAKSVAVLVEDQLSAASVPVYTQYTGVALLGTNISDQLANHLRKRKVILALDPDALERATKLYFKYRSVMDIRLARIQDDLKNLTPQQRAEQLERYD